MTSNQRIKKIELHYVFADGDNSHTLDAFTRNKCEQAFLRVANEIISSFGGYVNIVVEPHKNGGLRDFYTFIVSSKGGNLAAWSGVAVSVFSLAVSVVSLVMQIPSADEKTLTKLSIEKTTLEIEKLRAELEALNNGNGKSGTVFNLETLGNNVKIKRQKSNFYTGANECSKIHAIELSEINPTDDSRITGTSVYIARSDFDRFITKDIPVDSETIENATIEIFAPVLIKSKIAWKGIWKQGETHQQIDFKISPGDFLENVENQTVTFRHGTHIVCDLIMHKKVDAEGNVVVSRYVVANVTKIYDGAGTERTFQRRAIPKTKQTIENIEQWLPGLEFPQDASTK